MTQTRFFHQALPADQKETNERRQVSDACFSWVKPLRPEQPSLLMYNESFANDLGLNFSKEEAQAVFSGQKDFPGQEPYAMCYGGHQFGQWAGS